MSGLWRLARKALGYEVYHIYGRDAGPAHPPPPGVAVEPAADGRAFAADPDPDVRALAAYAGADAFGLVGRVGGELAGGCWVWSGERYRRDRGFVRLAADEAKLVQVTVAGRFRGRGIAPALVAAAAAEAQARGFRRLLARIWHSHAASVRAFEKAGWAYLHTALVVRPFGLGPALRLRLHRPPARP